MVDFLNTVDSVLYYPILIIVLAAAGIYFSIRTRFVQIRLFVEALRTLFEKPHEMNGVSSLEALLVSNGIACGHGKHYRCFDGDLPRRTGRRVLDVGACDCRSFVGVCREHTCANL